MTTLPKIIQGGMGAGVSSWLLARAVSRAGQLGVVSGTALDLIVARRLQDGDRDGSVRHALEYFPFREIAARFIERYFVPGGKPADRPYVPAPMPAHQEGTAFQEGCVLGNFVEVFLAREGHDGPVGVNYLEKIQLPLLPSIYGAMLAGVAYVIVGAGIPLKLPAAIDRLTSHQPAAYEMSVAGPVNNTESLQFDPYSIGSPEPRPPLERPRFLAIISSTTLATTMLRRAEGRVDGLVVEMPSAGGHNAPPRGKAQFDDNGEPVYGEKDRVDLAKIRELGVPFWLAGGYGSAEQLRSALDAGACGVQVGTAFAFCEESALFPDYKNAVLRQVAAGTAEVFTDVSASPTGFPFKVVQLEGSLSEASTYQTRTRVCDLGYLRQAYRNENRIAFRCASEPVAAFIAKGGNETDTRGRKCLCNALMANIGHPQVRAGRLELPLITAGNDLVRLARFLPKNGLHYGAEDVIRTMLTTA